MNRKFFSIAAAALALCAASLSAQTSGRASKYDTSGGKVKLEFKYGTDDSYRILSTVNESVYINKRLHHNATIINRVTSKVTEAGEDGSGVMDCTFMTTENSTRIGAKAAFSYGTEYRSIYRRDKFGVFTISDEYFMPVVRDCPVFPDYAVGPGDSWTYEGHEAHDMRQGFNMEKPFKVPFTATYTYLGKEDNLHVISVKYELYTQTPVIDGMASEDYPVEMSGFSDELVYFDNERGTIDHYSETFRILFTTYLGYAYDYRGTAHAEVNEFVHVNNQENVNSVQKKVEDLGIKNVTVKQGEHGLTLSMEDIKFKAESSVLMESEKSKLDQIAKILQAYPDNDILVSGHTASASTGRDPQILSEERARTVADYLISLGVRDSHHIFTKGFGATKPIAPNTTEQNKAKNRRVEITLME